MPYYETIANYRERQFVLDQEKEKREAIAKLPPTPGWFDPTGRFATETEYLESEAGLRPQASHLGGVLGKAVSLPQESQAGMAEWLMGPQMRGEKPWGVGQIPQAFKEAAPGEYAQRMEAWETVPSYKRLPAEMLMPDVTDLLGGPLAYDVARLGAKAIRPGAQALARGAQQLAPAAGRLALSEAGRPAMEAVEQAPGLLRRVSGALSERAGKETIEAAPPDEAVNRLINFIEKEGKPARAELEVMKSDELKRRVAKAAGTRSTLSGRQAFYAAKGSLKGELTPEKVRFFPAKLKMGDEEIDRLFDLVDTAKVKNAAGNMAPLPELSKTATQEGLDTILRGEIPQPAQMGLLLKVFGSDLVRAVSKKTGNWDKLTMYWQAMILSGPRTHMRNIISNTMFGGMQQVQRPIKGALDVPVSAIQGRAREFYTSETLPAALAYLQGIPRGLAKAARIVKNGYDIADATKLEMPYFYQFEGLLKPVNIPGRFLAAADAFAKSISFDSELVALATRKALKEGLEGEAKINRIVQLIAEPTDEIINGAAKFSKFSTFTDDPDKLVEAALRVRELDVGPVQPMRFIIPFINTVWNITKRGVELTPVIGMHTALKGGAEVTETLGRQVIGSSVLLGAAALYADGRLTGAAPRDPAGRDAFYRMGKQPYSMNIGGRWVSYQMFTPLNIPFVLVAALGDEFTEKDEEPALNKVLSAAGVVGQSIIDMSFFTGLSNLMDMVQDPGTYGSRLAENISTGFLPFSGAQRNVAQFFDPLIRDPENIVQKLETGMPGLSKTIQPRLNAFGEEIERKGGGGIYAFLPNPMPVAEGDPVSTELDRLGVPYGFVGKKLAVGNEVLQLTNEQYREYLKLAGEAVYMKLQQAISAGYYEGLSDERKAEHLEKLIDQARDSARAKVKRGLRTGVTAETVAPRPATQPAVAPNQALPSLGKLSEMLGR